MRGVKTLACLVEWGSSSWGKGIGLVNCECCLISLVLMPRTSCVNAPHVWCCRQDRERHSNRLTYTVGRLNDRHNDIRSDGERQSKSLTFSVLGLMTDIMT